MRTGSAQQSHSPLQGPLSPNQEEPVQKAGKVKISSVYSLFTSSLRSAFTWMRSRPLYPTRSNPKFLTEWCLVTTLKKQQCKEAFLAFLKKRRVPLGASMASLVVGSSLFLYNQQQTVPPVKQPTCSLDEEPRFDRVSTACEVYTQPRHQTDKNPVCAVSDQPGPVSTLCFPSESPSEILFASLWEWLTSSSQETSPLPPHPILDQTVQFTSATRKTMSVQDEIRSIRQLQDQQKKSTTPPMSWAVATIPLL